MIDIVLKTFKKYRNNGNIESYYTTGVLGWTSVQCTVYIVH